MCSLLNKSLSHKSSARQPPPASVHIQRFNKCRTESLLYAKFFDQAPTSFMARMNSLVHAMTD